MSYIIDAWLERPDPCLRITHCHTGIRVLEWRNERLHTLLEQGVICAHDLQQPQCSTKELVQELFLLACLEGDHCGCQSGGCQSESRNPH
jgi:hypothetical protein